MSARAGVIVHVRRGESVEVGQPLLELHADDDAHLAAGRAEIAGAVVIGDETVDAAPLLLARVDA